MPGFSPRSTLAEVDDERPVRPTQERLPGAVAVVDRFGSCESDGLQVANPPSVAETEALAPVGIDQQLEGCAARVAMTSKDACPCARCQGDVTRPGIISVARNGVQDVLGASGLPEPACPPAAVMHGG